MQRPYKFDPPWIDFFTRPCPWFAKQLACFPLFSRLPRELQLMIWERAQPCRQIVALSIPTPDTEHTPPNATLEIYMQYRRPGMLEACYDARVAGLKTFTPSFSPYLPYPIRFNFALDCLELDIHMVEWIATIHETRKTPPIEPPRVKYLAVSHYRQFRGEDFVLICQYFSGLDVLMVNEPEIDGSKPTDGLFHRFTPEAAEFVSRHRWEDLRQPIMNRIRGVRPKLQSWKAPVFFVGTDTQWALSSLVPVTYDLRFEAAQVLPAHIQPAFCQSSQVNADLKADLMDWQPTISIPSLGFVERLEVVKPHMAALTIQVHTNNPKDEEQLSEELSRELFNEDLAMLAWVFEDSSLRFHDMYSDSNEDYANWSWPGRRYSVDTGAST